MWAIHLGNGRPVYRQSTCRFYKRRGIYQLAKLVLASQGLCSVKLVTYVILASALSLCSLSLFFFLKHTYFTFTFPKSVRAHMCLIQFVRVVRSSIVGTQLIRVGRSGVRFPVGARFYAPMLTDPEAHTASSTIDTVSLSWE
jgi:hypothetical protein